MKKQTNNGNTNYTSLLVVGGLILLAVVAFVNFGRPKNTEITDNNLLNQEVTPSVTKDSANEVTPTQAIVKEEELSKHSTKDNCWIMVERKVYDVTKVIPVHAGGEKAILSWCGKDATVAFNSRGGKGPHPSTVIANMEKMLMGLFEVKMEAK